MPVPGDDEGRARVGKGTDTDVQRKVTAFVTRGESASTELLVFWHAGSGVQIPAGTVEDGESFEEAARREAAEETGLDCLRLVRLLGERRHQAPAGHAFLGKECALHTRPGHDAPATNRTLGRVQVEVVERAGEYARVRYEERDLDAPEGCEPLVYARLEGWVPADLLRSAQLRRFYHFRAVGPTPEKWSQQAEPEHVFELSWVPLRTAGDRLLVEQKQQWLDEFADQLT
ncbi:MAG TPA: NUDIX domain-containing protein [Actinopolymorphaceae bacterium]